MAVKFTDIYKKYKQFYEEKNSEALLNTLLDIKFEEICGSHTKLADKILQTSFWIIGEKSKTCKIEPNFIIHAINGYTELLQAHNDHLDLCLTTLLLLADGRKLGYVVSMIVNLEKNAFDVIQWLHSTADILINAIDNSKDLSAEEQLKTLYLKLSRVLLFFINIEAQYATVNNSSIEYTASRYLLTKCMNCSRFLHADQQYIECFKFLEEFVENIALNGGSLENTNWMEKTIEAQKILNKKVRATLAQDNYITLSNILHASQKYIISTLTATKATALLKLFKSIADGLCVTKSTKSMCEYECNEDNIHSCYGLYEISIDVAIKMTENEHEMSTPENLLKLIRSTFTLLAKSTCKRAKNMQNRLVSLLKQYISMGNTKSKAIMIIPVVIDMLRQSSATPAFAAMEQMNTFQLLRKLWILYQTSENWEKFIEIGYILIAHNKDSQMDRTLLEYVVYWTTMRIKDMTHSETVKTPNEYFSSKGNSIYNLKMPATFDIVDIACAFFNYSTLNEQSAFNDKYVNQLIEYAAAKDAEKRARFLHYLTYLNINKRNNKHLGLILKALETKIENPSAGLLYSKILYLQYSCMITALTEKRKDVHLSVEFTYEALASTNSIFRQMNFDSDVSHLERLREMQRFYIKFIDFYLEKSTEAREQGQFAAEKSKLFQTGKLIANHLILRGFLDYGLQLYWKLHQFATVENDEFGMIESCSYLAEYSAELKSEMKDLNAAVAKCNEIAKEKLQTFNSLLSRKQNLLLNYLLNLITFMYESCTPDEERVLQLLLFVIGMIGGIDNKLVSSIYGDEVEIKTVPNKAFDAIRFKIYATVFTMTTKYNTNYPIEANRLMEHMLRFLKDNVSIVAEATYSTAITTLKTLSMVVLYCQYHYEFTEYEALLLTMLKLAIRLGFVRTIAEITYMKLLLELGAENIASSKVKLNALNLLIQNDLVMNFDEITPIVKVATDNVGQCEPIRKENSRPKSPAKAISATRKVAKNYVFDSAKHTFLHHLTECSLKDCSLCIYPQNKLLMFRISCAYARYNYLNDDEPNPDGKLFQKLYEYLKEQQNTNGFQKTAQYYLDIVQMLIWYSHFEWKCAKNYERSQQLLKLALTRLDKVEHYDRAVKILINHSIEALDMIIIDKQKQPKTQQSNQKCSIKTNVGCSSTKTLKSNFELTKKVNLLDMINDDEPNAKNSNGVKFQIHEDESSSMELATPARKSKRCRDKKN